jgi:hypothetical protein
MNNKSNIATMIQALQIPETITPAEYPSIRLVGADGNVFNLMGIAAKAWRPVDRGVSERLFSVINNHAEGYDEVLGLLLSISSSASNNDFSEENEEDTYE